MFQAKGGMKNKSGLSHICICGYGTFKRESIEYRVRFTSITGALIPAWSEFQKPLYAKLFIYYVFIVTSSTKYTLPAFIFLEATGKVTVRLM